LDEPEERRESEEVVAVVVATSPAPNEDAVEEEQPAPVLKSSLSTEPLKIPIVAEVATAKDYKYESFSPYSPRKNMMKLSGGMSSSSSEDEEEEDLELLKQERNRRNSEQLESSTKLK
jgi:hypothetical protein